MSRGGGCFKDVGWFWAFWVGSGCRGLADFVRGLVFWLLFPLVRVESILGPSDIEPRFEFRFEVFGH